MPGREPAFDAIVFDLLTALLDSWTLWNHVAGSPERGLLWRRKYLELTYQAGAYRPYEDVVREAAQCCGLEAACAGELVRRWDELAPWPEAREVLAELAGRAPLGIATNCSMRLGRIAAERTGGRYAAIATAESVGYLQAAARALPRGAGAARYRPCANLVRRRLGRGCSRGEGGGHAGLLAQSPGARSGRRMPAGLCRGVVAAPSGPGVMSAPVQLADAPARSLLQLGTPCLLLDVERLERNCERMLARAAALGVRLRPHLKTAKSVEVAERATGGPPRGITVSTLKEAEYFAGHGYADIICATAIVPGKLAHAARIQASTGCDLMLVTDALSVVEAALRFAAESRTQLSFLVEIDCGEHRSGLPATDAALVELARADRPRARSRFRGVMTHAGHSYGTDQPAEVASIAAVERDAAVTAAAAIRAAGVPCEIVSVGSTPTLPAFCGTDEPGEVANIAAVERDAAVTAAAAIRAAGVPCEIVSVGSTRPCSMPITYAASPRRAPASTWCGTSRNSRATCAARTRSQSRCWPR